MSGKRGRPPKTAQKCVGAGAKALSLEVKRSRGRPAGSSTDPVLDEAILVAACERKALTPAASRHSIASEIAKLLDDLRSAMAPYSKVVQRVHGGSAWQEYSRSSARGVSVEADKKRVLRLLEKHPAIFPKINVQRPHGKDRK